MDRLAAHRMALDVLDEHVRVRPVVDRHLDDLARTRQGVAQDPRVDLEVHGIFAAAVDHAGNEAVPPQAPRGARTLRITGGEGER